MRLRGVRALLVCAGMPVVFSRSIGSNFARKQQQQQQQTLCKTKKKKQCLQINRSPAQQRKTLCSETLVEGSAKVERLTCPLPFTLGGL
jgi:hypothetical protein